MLGVIGACCAEPDDRLALLSSNGSNEETLRNYFAVQIEGASKHEIVDANPTMDLRTVERVLQKLQAEGCIEKMGAARATRCRRVR